MGWREELRRQNQMPTENRTQPSAVRSQKSVELANSTQQHLAKLKQEADVARKYLRWNLVGGWLDLKRIESMNDSEVVNYYKQYLKQQNNISQLSSDNRTSRQRAINREATLKLIEKLGNENILGKGFVAKQLNTNKPKRIWDSLTGVYTVAPLLTTLGGLTIYNMSQNNAENENN